MRPDCYGASGSSVSSHTRLLAWTAFLVDFLPVIRRALTRTGFVIDHVRYFSDALKPWIARRERLDRFVLRRDPPSPGCGSRAAPSRRCLPAGPVCQAVRCTPACGSGCCAVPQPGGGLVRS